MKLSVDLSLLMEAVKKMEAADISFEIVTDKIPLEPIDVQLNSGFECELNDIEFKNGLASYEGRQVLLYIKDHSYKDNIVKALNDPKKHGRKFHIADCETLKDMRAKKRYDRYVVTNNLNGKFLISGVNQFTHKEHYGEVELAVCKYCLTYLNYQGYQYGNSQAEIFNKFSITSFFDTYSSVFSYLPSGVANVRSVNYTPDWNSISLNYKSSKKYICQCCKVDLSNARQLLHVHHINGVKNDNRHENLIVLCADCHRKQVYHDHMFLSFSDSLKINAIRNEQSLISIQSWDDVYKYADPAMYGLIGILQNKYAPIPSVGEIVSLSNGVLLNTGLSWHEFKTAITLDPTFTKDNKYSGWTVYNMAECLNDIDDILHKLK